MTKQYYKECKTAKEAVAFMKKYNVEVTDAWYIENFIMTGKDELDFDGWLNSEETKGASVQINKNLEVFITKYTKKDIEELEATL